MNNDSIEKMYEKAFGQAVYLQSVFPEMAKKQMAEMVETMARSNGNIDAILSTNQSVSVKGGFIAEEVHAETFNLDAILKNEKSRAYTDRNAEWSSFDWNGAKLKRNDVPDVVIAKDGKVTVSAQSKYYDSPENTATQMSQIKDNHAKYEKVDILLGPDEQVNSTLRKVPGESEPVPTTTIKEHAEAKAAALEAKNGNTAEIDAYKQTANKCQDKISQGKASSKPLSKSDADKLGSGDKSKLQQIEADYQTASTMHQMGNAAVGAFALSCVASGSMNTVRYIQLAKEGKITVEEATFKIIGETAASAADSAIKAAANTGAQSLITRYGSKTIAVQALSKVGLKSLLNTNVVTVGVTCTIDAIKDLVRLGMGDISSREFFDRQGKGMMMTTAGVAGGVIGEASGVAMAGMLEITGNAALTLSGIVGGISGGLIAGLAMTMAIEVGIEKPYRDLVRNTSNLRDAARELERVSRNIFHSQILFTKFLEADAQMEQQFQTRLSRIDNAGKRALDIINQI